MDTTTGQQDTTQPRSTVSLDTPPTDTTATDQPLVEEEEEEEEEEYLRSDTLICVSMTEYSTHALIVQTVMDLVNKAGQRARNIFDQLDRRLKSADNKEQSGDRGQGVGGQPHNPQLFEHCMNFCTDA